MRFIPLFAAAFILSLAVPAFAQDAQTQDRQLQMQSAQKPDDQTEDVAPVPAVPAEPQAAAPITQTIAVGSVGSTATAGAPEVAAAEAYLNGIRTMKAHFVQTANDGKQVSGTFMMKRPGRLRFQYDPPVTDFIVADGTFIHYYDGQMKQGSSALISKSLADFFLRKNLKLSEDVEVSNIQRQDNLLLLTVVQAKKDLSGSLILAFTESPLTLRKWQVVDAQGAVTQVELSDVETGISLDNKLFDYYDPERKKGNLNK